MRTYVFECSRGKRYQPRVFVICAQDRSEAEAAAVYRARHWWSGWNGPITTELVFDWDEPTNVSDS